MSEIFENFILKQIAGEIVFSKERHSFQLSLRSITDSIRKAIYAEGEKWGMSTVSIDNCITKVRNTVELSHKPKEQSVQNVDISQSLKLGQQLKLYGSEKGRGEAHLHLLYVGVSKLTGYSRFMVLSSSRLALQPEDIVEPANNTLWSVGAPVYLSVYREGKRYPDEERVYRTYQLGCITLIKPSKVHEVIDSREEFTHVESTATNNMRNISFGRNPMSLLLHEYSRNLPIYADFNEKGLGSFKSAMTIFKPSQGRDILFGVSNETHMSHSLYIETEEAGELYLETKELSIQLKKAAKAKIQVI